MGSTASTEPQTNSGAVGDALGAAVEFECRAAILETFGPDGITDYAPIYGGLGPITDGTGPPVSKNGAVKLPPWTATPTAITIRRLANIRCGTATAKSPPCPSPIPVEMNSNDTALHRLVCTSCG